jgi:hypothetical protein
MFLSGPKCDCTGTVVLPRMGLWSRLQANGVVRGCPPSPGHGLQFVGWGYPPLSLALLQALEVVGRPALPELLKALLVGLPPGTSVPFDSIVNEGNWVSGSPIRRSPGDDMFWLKDQHSRQGKQVFGIQDSFSASSVESAL